MSLEPHDASPPVNREEDNPFSTRFVRPGALEYLFPGGESAELLLARFHQHGDRGAIVGPHGSGKSTLLATLLPRLSAAGWNVERCDLRDGQRSLPRGWLRRALAAPRPLIMIDGYEQLSQWQRFRLTRACRRPGVGLLVTAHADVGLPRLWITEVDLARASELFSRLVRDAEPRVTLRDLQQRLQNHPADLRGAWFALYDLYEDRRRAGPPPRESFPRRNA